MPTKKSKIILLKISIPLKSFCLSDILIIQKWVDYAKGLGDPTSELFHSYEVKYQSVYKVAKDRSKEFQTFLSEQKN